MEASGRTYTEALSELYPTRADVAAEIAELEGRLTLPRSTELFASDIHGEYNAFSHVLRGGSGAMRALIEEVFGSTLNDDEKAALLALACYPAEHCAYALGHVEDADAWLAEAAARLAKIARRAAGDRTIDEVRALLPDDLAIAEELVAGRSTPARQPYREAIIESLVASGEGAALLEVLGALIQHLVVDQLHLIGDVYDRGPAPQLIMDELLSYPNVDVQWGNHDILWMGAACGSRTLVATVLANSIHYNNLEVIETGYGISLRPLSVFANEEYRDCDVHRFAVKLTGPDADQYSEKDKLLSARMHKAITIILFKLEGQKLLRHPEYDMADRLLLDKIDYENRCITIGDVTYPLEDTDFPTVDPKDPYTLTPEEESVIDQLTASFQRSEKLQKHVRFLYSKGSLYKVFNGNLLFHGCVPMTEDGQLLTFTLGGKARSGKEFFDFADTAARQAYYHKPGSPERQQGMDFLWFLWAGRNSPIFGRNRMTTFERRLIKDESAWTEPKNAYYTYYQDPAVCDDLLKEFGLEGPHCHIINGHIPVKSKKGESPIKGGGKLLVIDGGFCKAYQPTTGIAGYTLIYNSWVLRLVSHQPFCGQKTAIEENVDIASSSEVFERMEARIKIAQTDVGKKLQAQADALRDLLEAYRAGAVLEDHRE